MTSVAVCRARRDRLGAPPLACFCQRVRVTECRRLNTAPSFVREDRFRGTGVAQSSSVSTSARANRADCFVLALLAISLATNLLLGIGVLRLAARPAPGAATPPAGPSAPAIGSLLPPLEALGADGSRERLTFEPSGRPTLLYVFAPGCGWCARNLDNVKAIFAGARHSHRLVALSLASEAGGFVDEVAVEVRVLVQPSPAAIEAYRLGSTPTTLVISPEGRVVKSWVGAYVDVIGKEVEAYFNVKLPGVQPEGRN